MRRIAIIWLITTQALEVMLLLPWLAIAGLTVMVFDAPGSTEMWQPWAFALTVWSYPLWPLVFGGLSWLFLRRRHFRLAIVTSSVPLAIPAILVIFLIAVQG